MNRQRKSRSPKGRKAASMVKPVRSEKECVPTGKKCFTVVEARRQARYLTRLRNYPYGEYRCNKCQEWHVGSTNIKKEKTW